MSFFFRISFLLLALFSLLQAQPTRPNIVLIMADDLGYEALNCNGGTSYETMNLNRLAETGMRFTHAYSTPLCTPSRVQLMTGKYNFRNYVGFGILDPGETTFGDLMKAAGYETCVVGKWQLYGNARQREMFERKGTLPEEAGFDDYCLWQVKDKFGPRFKSPYLEIKGEKDRAYPDQYGPDIFLEYAEEFMAKPRENPFFLYYPMVLTHAPFRPVPGMEGYAEDDPSKKLNDPTYFADNVAYMDQIVGKLVKKIDDLGIREETLIIFIGDNGTDRSLQQLLGEGVSGAEKGYPTNGGTHVPMIANWSEVIPGGEVNDNLIDFTDFVPTMLELARGSAPKDFVMDGISFYGQLTGEDYQPREWVFCHYAPQWGKFEHTQYVHDREYKLYVTGEMYDLQKDPKEKRPLQSSEMTDEMRELYNRFEEVLGTYRVKE